MQRYGFPTRADRCLHNKTHVEDSHDHLKWFETITFCVACEMLAVSPPVVMLATSHVTITKNENYAY